MGLISFSADLFYEYTHVLTAETYEIPLPDTSLYYLHSEVIEWSYLQNQTPIKYLKQMFLKRRDESIN